jgi:hypothetical protein
MRRSCGCGETTCCAASGNCKRPQYRRRAGYNEALQSLFNIKMSLCSNMRFSVAGAPGLSSKPRAAGVQRPDRSSSPMATTTNSGTLRWSLTARHRLSCSRSRTILHYSLGSILRCSRLFIFQVVPVLTGAEQAREDVNTRIPDATINRKGRRRVARPDTFLFSTNEYA